jgi:hypothetical protein
MNYHKKYLKYKTKYNNLKYKQYGGENGKLMINNIDMTDKLTILSYDIISNKIFAKRRKPDTNVNLTIDNKILDYPEEKIKYELINVDKSFIKQIFEINTFDTHLLKIEYEYNGMKNFVELSKIYKLFNINFIYQNDTYSLFILTNIIDFETTDLQIKNYFTQGINTSSYFILKIKTSESKIYKLSGICQITKSKTRLVDTKPANEIIFDIAKINDIDCNIYNLIDFDNLFIRKFNLQISYDNIKAKYNYCPESTILYKHIYNTFYNFFMIEENKFVTTFQDVFGGLIEQIIINKLKNNNSIIRNLCSDTQNRQKILSNVMKRIETTMNKGVIIKKNDGTFIDLSVLNPSFHLIFDTGNASHTLITRDIVNALGLTRHDTFPLVVSGVAGSSSKLSLNKYVDIELYFDPTLTNINIDKHFKFRAYVQESGLTNTLLLGQSAYGLKQFFDNSYCIGYNTPRLDYDKQKLDANIKYSEYLRILNDVVLFLENIENFNMVSFIRLNAETQLINIQNILSYIEPAQIDELYQLCTKIKQQIKDKKNIIDKISTVYTELNDFITQLNNL